jgi:undecaprenyl-diphosphatase
MVLAASAPLSYVQAVVMGVLQGVTELFPISSLGHSVLLPGLIPGWTELAKAQTEPNSFFLTFVVGLHVATALALLIFFWKDWVAVIKGFFRTLRDRRIGPDDTDARMAWLIIVGTVPVLLVALVAEKSLRDAFAKPELAAILLMVNGLILLGGELLRRRADQSAPGGKAPRRDLTGLALPDGALVGGSQILALFAGISRSGITMVTGLVRGLSHEDAVRFSFMLATPVILAAGLYKLPELTKHQYSDIRGQILVGAVAAGIAAFLSAKFLVKWFQTRTLTPFAIYCLVFGAFCAVHYA